MTTAQHPRLQQPDTGIPLQPSLDGTALVDSHGTVAAPVVNNIPRFVTDQHLESFGFQWTRFNVAHEDEDKATFLAKTGVSPDSLRGLSVLDAGCGGGRYTLLCGSAGALVTATDHSRAVDKAAELCRHLPNTRFLQADLKQLPLPENSFDFVFSIGVMHHDASTQAVFQAVARLVRPGGRLSVWLYRRNQWWQEIINSTLRAVTTRLPTPVLLPLCHLGAILGGTPLINRTLNKIVCFSAHPCYENRVCDTWDWWAPQYQHHHTAAELADWFTAAGFTNIQELPPEKTGTWYRRLWQWNLLPGSGVNITGIRRP